MRRTNLGFMTEIFDSPQNPWYPCKWFTRNYGFFSPTPMYWLENGSQLKKSESLNLQYRVIVHAGDVEQSGIQKLFSQWARKVGQ